MARPAVQPLKPTSQVDGPTSDDILRLAYDPNTNAIVYKLRKAGTIYESWSANQASINALNVDAAKLGTRAADDYQLKADTLLSTTATGTSLVVGNGTALKIRGLATRGGGLSLDATTEPVTIVGQYPTLFGHPLFSPGVGGWPPD